MKVNIDTAGFSYVNGVIAGVSEGTERKSFISATLKYVHADLNTQFETFMDTLAMSRPENLTHVYEWGQLGMPAGRLWESVLRGRGADRTATVVWKASTKAVPVRPELLEPGPTGKTVKEGVHIFYWKAPVMEAGIQITVNPQTDGSGSLAYFHNGALRITKKPSTFTAGGGKTTGQFTMAYYTFWNSMAQNIYSTQIAPRLQNSLANRARGAIKSRRITALSLTGDRSNYQKGHNLGIKGLAAQTRNYEAAAAARRAFLYGA